VKLSLTSAFILIVISACGPQEQLVQEDEEAVSVTEGYQLPVFTDQERWMRTAYIWTVSSALYLDELKKRGLSPAESGQVQADIFSPGWSSVQNAMDLFSAMYRNWSMIPGNVCEVSEATEETVKATCNRPYLAFFEQSGGDIYGMSLAEYEESNISFNSGIAASVGMNWHQELEGDDFHITITRTQ